MTTQRHGIGANTSRRESYASESYRLRGVFWWHVKPLLDHRSGQPCRPLRPRRYSPAASKPMTASRHSRKTSTPPSEGPKVQPLSIFKGLRSWQFTGCLCFNPSMRWFRMEAPLGRGMGANGQKWRIKRWGSRQSLESRQTPVRPCLQRFFHTRWGNVLAPRRTIHVHRTKLNGRPMFVLDSQSPFPDEHLDRRPIVFPCKDFDECDREGDSC